MKRFCPWKICWDDEERFCVLLDFPIIFFFFSIFNFFFSILWNLKKKIFLNFSCWFDGNYMCLCLKWLLVLENVIILTSGASMGQFAFLRNKSSGSKLETSILWVPKWQKWHGSRVKYTFKLCLSLVSISFKTEKKSLGDWHSFILHPKCRTWQTLSFNLFTLSSVVVHVLLDDKEHFQRARCLCYLQWQFLLPHHLTNVMCNFRAWWFSCCWIFEASPFWESNEASKVHYWHQTCYKCVQELRYSLFMEHLKCCISFAISPLWRIHAFTSIHISFLFWVG